MRFTTLPWPSLVLSLALTFACSDDAGTDDHDHDHETGSETAETDDHAHETTETSGESLEVELRFAARFGDEAAQCGQTYAGIGAMASNVTVQDLRFYVSGVELIDQGGNAVALELAQDGLWQYEDLALLDFEDGTANCQDGGTAERNDVVLGSVPAGDYQGVRFVLGVPAELNHQDATSAPSPLNLPSMFWNWQGGYKFVRIDLVNEHPESPAWFIHLGSTGCESGGPDQPPSEACARGNRPTIELGGFDPASSTIVLDVAAMLAGVDVSQNMAGPPGCMSSLDDPECPALFPNLGLSLDTGACIEGCSAQTAFHVE